MFLWSNTAVFFHLLWQSLLHYSSYLPFCACPLLFRLQFSTFVSSIFVIHYIISLIHYEGFKMWHGRIFRFVRVVSSSFWSLFFKIPASVIYFRNLKFWLFRDFVIIVFFLTSFFFDSFDFCWPFLPFVTLILFALVQSAISYSSRRTWPPKGNPLGSNIVPRRDHSHLDMFV